MEEQKSRRLLKIVGLLLALGLAMAWGMVIGGALVYAWTHFVEQPERQARVKTVVLGGLPREEQRDLQALGALVVAVVPDSPADRAGLREGDRIVAIDGQRLGFERDLADLISQYEPGDRIALHIRRPGEDSFQVRAKLGEHPERQGRAYLGVKYSSAPSLQIPGMRIVPFDGSDGSFQFDVPLDDFEFDLDDLPGKFRLHVVPAWDDSF
jgi:hypothetical protein